MPQSKDTKQVADKRGKMLVQLPYEKSITALVRDARDGLIRGLAAVENQAGWSDPSLEGAQPFWTSVEVLKSLVEAGVYPSNYYSVLSTIECSRKTLNSLVGWEYEGIEGHISSYVTGDVIRLYLALRRFDGIEELVRSLQNIQNEDGGWGVCEGDRVSKVRSTSWVLSVLLSCLNCSPTSHMVSQVVIAKGITWLHIAQNDLEGDSGWGNMPDTLPSNVSATAFALDALLEAAKYSVSQRGEDIPVRRDAVRRGLQNLIGMGSNGFWRGMREEFAISIEGRVVGRHVIGGAGATSVLQVIIKAVEAGLLSWPNDTLLEALRSLAERCRSYSRVGGLWLVPADDGGSPLTWNSAYALDAFTLAQEFFANYFAGKWIEKTVYKKMVRPVRIWQSLCFALAFAVGGIVLAPYARSIGNIPSWFAGLPILYQGLIMGAITLLFEQLYRAVSRLLALWSQARKKSTHPSNGSDGGSHQ